MEKLLELAKEKCLAQSLMSDTKFVEEAKGIFKESGVELSNEQLADLMGKVEENLRASKTLSETELDNVVAGAKNSKAVLATEITGTIVGTVAGGLALGALGSGIGTKISKSSTPKSERGCVQDLIAGYSGMTIGGGIGGGVGATAGALVGYKISELICKSSGLK